MYFCLNLGLQGLEIVILGLAWVGKFLVIGEKQKRSTKKKVFVKGI